MAKSQTRASRKWNESNLDRLYITVEKGMKEVINSKAKEKGMSLNGYVNHLIEKDLK